MSCTADTPSVALAVAGGNLSASLKISADAGNEAVVHADGLYVGGPDITIPSGVVLDYSGTAAPTGWLLADGSAVSRSTYATLFALVGTRYGSGDGSTTFNLPDYRGRVSVGYAASGGHTDVSTLGANDGQSPANRRSKHQTTKALTVSTNFQAGYLNNAVTGFVTGTGELLELDGQSLPRESVTLNGSIGGSIGTNNANDAVDTPSYIVANKIIKT